MITPILHRHMDQVTRLGGVAKSHTFFMLWREKRNNERVTLQCAYLCSQPSGVIQLQCCTPCSLCLLLNEIFKKQKRKEIDKGDLAKVKETTKKQRAKEIKRGNNERWRKWERSKDLKRDKDVPTLKHNFDNANKF